MAYSNYGTCTLGGTAQDILAEGHQFMSIVFNNESDTAMRIRVDGTATSITGEIVYPNSSATFNNLAGRRMSMLCATTAKIFSYREAL
jgi:hypothetical protein